MRSSNYMHQASWIGMKSMEYLYVYFYPSSAEKQFDNRKRSPFPGSNLAKNEYKGHLSTFLSVLNEKQRRLYLGFESLKIGHGGDIRIASEAGVNVKTVARGRKELLLKDITPERIRQEGAGRPPLKKEILAELEKLISGDIIADWSVTAPYMAGPWKTVRSKAQQHQGQRHHFSWSAHRTMTCLRPGDFRLGSCKKTRTQPSQKSIWLRRLSSASFPSFQCLIFRMFLLAASGRHLLKIKIVYETAIHVKRFN